MSTKIENVVIESTMLGYEDHGILTAFIFIKGSGWGGGFGGYGMDSYDKKQDKRVGVPFCGEFIAAVLSTVGVDKWESLKGKHIRVESEGWGGTIRRIGHIIEDKWFDPKELAERLKSA